MIILGETRFASAAVMTPQDAFKAVTQFDTSPVIATAVDWQSSFTASDGRRITAIVKAPDSLASSGGTYQVPAMGASDNVYSYFQNAIAKVRSANPRPSLVVFPQANYDLVPRDAAGVVKSSHLDFSGLSDVTFDFSNSQINFGEVAPVAGSVQKASVGLLISSSQRLAIKNLSVDWYLPGGAQLSALGTIQASASGHVLVIDSSYPVQSPALPIQVTSLYDLKNHAWVQSPKYETYFNSANFPIQSSTNPQLFTSNAFASYPIGSTVVIRYFRFEGHAVYVTGRNTNDISFENVTLLQAPGMGFTFYNAGRGVRISGCKVMRNANDPLRLISTASDASHITNSLGDIIFENNDFSMQGDDGLNLHSTLNPVETVPTADSAGNTTMNIRFNNERYAVGDVIGFFNSDLAMIGTARLVSFAVTGSVATLTLDASIAGFVGAIAPWSIDGNATTFNSLISNLSLSGNRFIIRGNRLHDNRARALLVQTGNGLIQNNFMSNQTLNSAYLAASVPNGEGPGANNIFFTGNSLTNSGNINISTKPLMMGALVINSATQFGNSNKPSNQYIVLSYNSFKNSPGPALFLSSAQNLRVLNNSFTAANLQTTSITSYGATDSTHPLVLTNDFNSFFQSNTFDASPISSYGIDTASIDAFSLNVSEDNYQGDAIFNVSLDGKDLGGNFTATANHSLRQSQNLTWTGSWGKGGHQVSVSFLNDNWGGSDAMDRNLYIDSLSYNGVSPGPGSGVLSNGSVKYQIANSLTAVDNLVLNVSEDAYLGDAFFYVSIDGQQVGGVMTTKALFTQGQSQSLNYSGNWGTTAGSHQVSVQFLNDAWGGTASTDRNLYINSVLYNEHLLTSGTTSIFSNGTVSLSFP